MNRPAPTVGRDEARTVGDCYAVAMGDPVSGFHFFGPYATKEAANTRADSLRREDWSAWVIRMEKP